MELKDRGALLDLMEEHGISRRKLAELAGYKSHAYVNRLLSTKPGVSVSTLGTDPAIRIAYHLGVPVTFLFRTKASGERAQGVQRKAS